jgi:DNA-binding beta-propeller fold protein YncE
MEGKGIGELDRPMHLTVAPNGKIYVADFYNHRVQSFAPDFSLLFQIGKKGRILGGNFNYPTDVAIGPKGFLYVADAYNNRIQKFAPLSLTDTDEI